MKSEYKHFIIIILGMILIGIFLSSNSKRIDIVGEIIAISEGGSDSMSIIVADDKDVESNIIIDQRTLIYRGEDSTRIAYSELEIGDKVEVISRDGVKESYPMQAVGEAVRIKE